MSPTPATSTPIAYRRLWRRFLWHRRKLAALCAAVAVVASLNVLKPTPTPTVVVVTAQHELTAGMRLTARDLVEVRYPEALAPERRVASLSAVVGRILTAGLARGTPVTSLSLTGDAWSNRRAGDVAVPVRLQDSTLAGLLRPGQHVRLSAVDARTGTDAQTLVDDAVVLAVPQEQRADPSTGRLVVFDVPADRADAVTSQAVSRYLTVTWGH